MTCVSVDSVDSEDSNCKAICLKTAKGSFTICPKSVKLHYSVQRLIVGESFEGVAIDRSSFISNCDSILKLVRTEYGLTQEEMAHTLGLSKKTLVDIEKERRSLGWMGSVALCLIFQDSEVIAGVFGGQPTDIIMALAFEGKASHYPRVTGSRIWWINLYENASFCIQQNVISQHYRLLTIDGRRIASSFDLDDLMPLFNGAKR